MMTRKTEKAYKHALQYVNDNIFRLQCEATITDFEVAMRQAIRKVVPGVKQLGCWFHYAQAIRRKVATLSELFELVRTDGKIRNVYYKIICLALLPHDKIEKAFNELALEGLQLTKAFTPFVKYFQNQWLTRVGAKNFSVFLEETRTTGAAEGYNGKLGKKFQTHPNFFVFIESLQWEELAKSNALEQHINGSRQTQPKKMYRERATQIRNESIKFTIPNKTNAQLFLNRIANTKNNMLPKEFEHFENIVPYVDDSEELLDDNCAEIDSAHTEISKNSKRTQKTVRSKESKSHSTETTNTIVDNNSKNSKQIQKTTRSKEPKSHTKVDCTETTNTKVDNNLKISKQTRKKIHSEEPKSDITVESTFNQTTGKGMTTRSKSKILISSGQN